MIQRHFYDVSGDLGVAWQSWPYPTKGVCARFITSF